MFSGYSYYLNNVMQVFTRKEFKGWGRKKTGRFALFCERHFGGRAVLLEDGFIRSVGLGVEGSPSFSLVEDDVGIYYDARQASKLENILNTYAFSEDIVLMQTANEAMNLIRKHHISKYNNAANISDDFFKNDRLLTV